MLMSRQLSLLLLLTVPLLLSLPAQAQEGAPAEPTLAVPPKLKTRVRAVVPAGTKFPSPEVIVQLKLEVDDRGAVSSVKLLKGAGEPFDGAALAAARKFVFEPARLTNGETVPVEVSFRLRIRAPARVKLRPVAVKPPPAPVSYTGILLQRGTRRPLDGVEVVAAAARGGKQLTSAVTDSEGRFSMKVPAARFDLSAAVTGHQPLKVTVKARPGEQREEIFYLETVQRGKNVTVVRSERIRREVTRQVLPKKLVERIPGTAGDTLKVVQILPGVARSSFDGGQIILRGASPGDSRIFLEGQEIPILYHFGGLRSTFNSVFLEAVEFIPGNFGPDYGRAMGGVIDVRVRDPARDMFRGLVNINLYDAGAAVEGPLSRNWSLGGAFRRSYIDAILPAVLPDDVPLSFDSLPRFYDYQLLATWRPDARRRLRLMFYGSLDRLAATFDRPASDPVIRGALDARIMFHNLQASYSHRLSGKVTQDSSLQIGMQQLKTALGPEIFFELSVTRLSARSTWTYEHSRRLAFRAGLDFRTDWVDIALNSPLRAVEGEQLPPLSTQQLFGIEQSAWFVQPALFVEARLRPTDKLTILLSTRVDAYSSTGQITVDPRVMATYRLPWGTLLKAGFGSYHQPPSADQVNDTTGNPDLMSPASVHGSVGFEHSFGEMVDVEVTGFYKWLDQQVIRNPAFFYDPSLRAYLSQGSGRIFGVEALVRARLGDRFTGWLAYTFQRSFRTDGPDATERRFDFDQPHILTLVGTVKIGRGWSAGLRFRLVSGNPYTPVNGAIYDTSSGTYVPIFGETNSERQELFHQLDLRVDKLWTFERWKLSAFLDIQNVYNQRNPEGVSYSYDYRKSQPLTGLPILPILGIKGEW